MKIKPQLRDLIINLQESDTWEIQLAIVICIISQKGVDGERVKHSKNNIMKFSLFIKAIEPVLSSYQGNLEISMRGSDFVFYSVQLIY